MPKKTLLICFLLFVTISVPNISAAFPYYTPWSGNTQFVHQSYNWVQKRGILKLDDIESQEAAIILKDRRVIEYAYDYKTANLIIYDTRHKIIRVNSDAALDEYNKIYISVANALNIIEIKARFISKTGRIVELDKNQIKDLDNPNNAGLYKIFAIAGAEVGGEIEYIYTIKQEPKFFGREIFQTAVPAKDVSMEIITPNNIVFEAKSYNNFPQMEREDDRYPDKNALTVHVGKMLALLPEDYSYQHSNLMRIEYKLSYYKESNEIDGDNKSENTGEGNSIFTWDALAEIIHSTVYNFKELNSEERQKYDKYLKKMIPADVFTSEEKIKRIENYIKRHIRISERYSNANEKEETPLDILKNNYGTSIGIVRLFAALFTLADVEHEIVLTTDRTNVKFDKEFASWHYLDKYLFHFPNTKNFLAPHNSDYKYGMVPHNYTHNQGLFISPSYEGFDIYKAKVQEIPAIDYQSNYDLTELAITFDRNFSSANIHLKRSFVGYNAIDLQYHYENSSEDQKKEVIDNLFQKFGNDVEVRNTKVNQQKDDPYTNYFRIETDLKTSSPIEMAGSTYIFNLGEIISKQSQLMQDDNRILNIERDYQQGYHKVVFVEIPKDYWIKNLKSLNHDIFLEENGERTAAFTVHYDVVGNNLIRIEIEEYYKKIDYAKEHYEQYSKVVNAATNFEKMALIFEKEK